MMVAPNLYYLDIGNYLVFMSEINAFICKGNRFLKSSLVIEPFSPLQWNCLQHFSIHKDFLKKTKQKRNDFYKTDAS